MLVGCAGILMAAATAVAPIREIPPALVAKFAPTNEVSGTFVQRKFVAEGDRETMYETRGTYRLRPGRDFTWKTLEPFVTCFHATPTNYVYSNEDERTSRPLKELPGYSQFKPVFGGDFSVVLRAFRATYAEENGRHYLRARPDTSRLSRYLKRVDVEGSGKKWKVIARLANEIRFEWILTDE